MRDLYSLLKYIAQILSRGVNKKWLAPAAGARIMKLRSNYPAFPTAKVLFFPNMTKYFIRQGKN